MINKPIIMSVPKNAKGNPSDFTVIKTSEFEQMKTKAKFQRAYIIELRRGLTIENTENNRLRIANYELSAKIEKLEQKISRLTR